MHAIRSAYIDGVYQSADCMNEISLLDTCIHLFLPHDSVVAVVTLERTWQARSCSLTSFVRQLNNLLYPLTIPSLTRGRCLFFSFCSVPLGASCIVHLRLMLPTSELGLLVVLGLRENCMHGVLGKPKKARSNMYAGKQVITTS